MTMTTQEADDRLMRAITERLKHEYESGKADGLKVAVQIRNWLTRQPDRKWQKEAREIADKLIESVKTN